MTTVALVDVPLGKRAAAVRAVIREERPEIEERYELLQVALFPAGLVASVHDEPPGTARGILSEP